MGGDLSFWADTVARLQSQFQVIVFDNRGIGRSDAPDVPYTIEKMADDTVALLDELDLESVHVLGFSMGGNIAQAFALKYPERLHKLIIAASYAKMNPQAEHFLDAVLSVYETGATPEQMYRLILPWLFSPRFLEREENTAYLEFDANDPLQQPLYAFRRQYMAQKATDSRHQLGAITTEALVLAGERDALVAVEDARELAAGISRATLTVLPDAGHLFNVEQPELFHALITRFLCG